MPGDRDLGEMLAVAVRRVLDAEAPLLDAHGLTMWEYVVLARLGRGAAPTQLALARAVGYDKTRLIALLDALARRELIVRTPDPADRRAHLVTLTDAGRARLAAVRAEIRAMEAGLLEALPESDRVVFRRVLDGLAPRRDDV
jgi:DNA-binding MarR family transcriptional regulator